MNFQVCFRSNKATAIDIPSQFVGLEFLDQAREESGVPNLPSDKCGGYFGGFSNDIDVQVSESVARKFPPMLKSYQAGVEVPQNGLSKYAKIAPKIRRNDTTGEVIEVQPACRIDYDAIILDWVDAGCPHIWEPEPIVDLDEV